LEEQTEAIASKDAAFLGWDNCGNLDDDAFSGGGGGGDGGGL